MAINVDIEPRSRRHGLHLPPKIILPVAGALAALAVGGYALSRGGETHTPPIIDNAPVSDSYKPPQEPEIQAVIPPSQDTEVLSPLKIEPLPELKPLPKVINPQTVKFVSLPDSEIITLLNQQKEPKIPLPEIPLGLSIKEIRSKTGHSMLAIYGPITNLDLPVLLEGVVVEVLTDGSANFDSIAFRTLDGKIWGYIVPSHARSTFKNGDPAKLNNPAISINYNPNDLDGKNFRTYLERQYTDAPLDTVAIIGGLNPTGGIKKDNILRTIDGSTVTTQKTGK